MGSRYKTIYRKRVLSCSPFDNPYITVSVREGTDLCPKCFRELKLDIKGVHPRSVEEEHHDERSNGYGYDPKFTKKFNFIGVYIQPYDNSTFPNNCHICGEYRCHGISPNAYLAKFRKELKHYLRDYRLYIDLVDRVGKSEADRVALVMNDSNKKRR